MKSRLLIVATFSILLMSCDSGDDQNSNNIIPDLTNAEATLLEEGSPEMVAVLDAAGRFGSILGDNFVIPADGSSSVSMTIDATSVPSQSGTFSLIVDATTGEPTSASLIVSSTGEATLVEGLPPTAEFVEVTATNEAGSTIRHWYTHDLVFVGASHEGPSSSGNFSSNYASKVNAVMSGNPRVLADYEIPDSDATAGELLNAWVQAELAGKRHSNVVPPIVLTKLKSDKIRLVRNNAVWCAILYASSGIVNTKFCTSGTAAAAIHMGMITVVNANDSDAS